MRHSSHSQARHELVSSHGPKSSGSKHSETMAKQKRGNMKCIVTVGILLPILAAIIGVAAWAVSGDSDRHQSSHSNIHRPSFQRGHISRFHNDLVPVLEERNDLLYDSGKVPIGGAVSKDILGTETVHEDDVNQVDLHADDYAAKPPISSSSEHPKDDPLYVVHYVPPNMKPEVATRASEENKPHEDVLSKILSAGKGAKKGTPQFVVFAPVPGDMGEKDSRKRFGADYDYDVNESQARAGTKTVRVKKMRKERKNESFDEEFDPRGSSTGKHRNRESSNGQRSSVVPRTGQYYSDNRPSPDQSFFQDDDDHFHQSQFGSKYPMPYNQQNHMAMNPMPMQQHQQGMMGGMKQHGQAGCCYPKPGRPNQGQGQNMQMMPMQQMQPMQQPQQSQQQNQNTQPGLTITLGNGNALPLGPLGILRQILRPTMDLRKKLFFGVQLENGFGLGRNNDNTGAGGGGNQGGGGGGGNGNLMTLYNG